MSSYNADSIRPLTSKLAMEEYCETHQLVRKRREIFENLARQNAETSQIAIKHTSRPWNRPTSMWSVAINQTRISHHENRVEPVRRVSGGSSVRNSRPITIHVGSDNEFIENNFIDNRDSINKIHFNYGDSDRANNAESVVSVPSIGGNSDLFHEKKFTKIAMEAEKEDVKSEYICDKISASDELTTIHHNNKTASVEEFATEENVNDEDFGECEPTEIVPNLVETRNLTCERQQSTATPEEDHYEQLCEEENIYEEIDEIARAKPVVITDHDVASEQWSDDEFESDSFDSGTEEDEGQDYDVAKIPPPAQLNIGKIHNVLDEIITTEDEYVKKLEIGIANYVRYMDNNFALPLELKGKKNLIFSVVEKIYEFHSTKFYPALLQCNYNLDELIEKFRYFIQRDYFYSYVLYAMNKPKSEGIVRQNHEFFTSRQNEIEDKLGLPSFLMQPIQRLPKYRLLIGEMIKEFMKNINKLEHDVKLKSTLANLCVAEKELQKVLDAANESISVNDIEFEDTFINIHHQGKFIRCGEFEIHDHAKTKQKYRGKVFLFNKALVYTEYASPDKKHVIYRGSYDRNRMGLRHDQTETYQENKKKFYIFDSKVGHNELEFNRTEKNDDNWYGILQQILFDVMEEERQKVKLNHYRMSRIQMNESVRTTLVKFNQPGDRSSSTSSGSITSDYISNRSSRCSGDSYEIGNSTWDERKNSEKIRNSEKYYINYLRACRKAYIDPITDDEQKSKISKFQKELDRIYNFHKNVLLQKILECGANYEDILKLFQMIFDSGKFHMYIKFSMVAITGYDMLSDLYPLGTNPINNQNVLSIDEYVRLPVYRIQYYMSLLDAYMQENKSNNNWNTDIFKTVAILQANLYKIHKKCDETFKLYSIRQNTVRLALYGSCEYSDLVSIDKFGTLNHRICVMEDGLILIKIKTNAETQDEHYKEIVFGLSYSTGLNMRGSKKNPKKISFDTDSQKSVGPSISFRSLEKREVFRNTLFNIKNI